MNKEKRFIQAFTGLQRAFGEADLSRLSIDPSTGKAKPVYGWAHREITEQDYLNHLSGKQSIGIQPCDDNGMASFGAIDIDDKQHSYINFPYKKYLDIIAENNLPLVPVKSKSGGLHLYLFIKDKIRAVTIRNFLEGLLFTLKLPTNIEIYPKQTELGKDSEGKWNMGQYINLPYYNKTERVGFNLDGTTFTFDQFVDVIDSNTYTADELEEFTLDHTKKILNGGGEEFNDGPPCLAILTKDKLTDGRDRFLYNYMVFAKKKYPDDWEKMVIAAPGKYFKPDSNGVIDWSETKTKQKLKSWGRETKGHTCNEDPIQPVCMKAECRKRKFGYLSDKQRIFPALSGLQKITYPEPQYTFNVTLTDGQTTKEVRAKNIKQIIELDNIRAIIGAAADMIPPKIKQNEFQDILDNLFPPKLTTPPPKGTTPDELLEEYLSTYLNGPKAKTHASFKTGAVLIEQGNSFFVYASFFNSLKNKEWKENRGITAERMKQLFKADFGVGKRFPKLPGQEKSNPPIDVVKIPLDKFPELLSDDETPKEKVIENTRGSNF
jgi:hypothetical protein|tara:strand:+ start:724 stop:2367 length:1644 start_codon:yes stop_codon:yes gene_type:complete